MSGLPQIAAFAAGLLLGAVMTCLLFAAAFVAQRRLVRRLRHAVEDFCFAFATLDSEQQADVSKLLRKSTVTTLREIVVPRYDPLER